VAEEAISLDNAEKKRGVDSTVKKIAPDHRSSLHSWSPSCFRSRFTCWFEKGTKKESRSAGGKKQDWKNGTFGTPLPQPILPRLPTARSHFWFSEMGKGGRRKGKKKGGKKRRGRENNKRVKHLHWERPGQQKKSPFLSKMRTRRGRKENRNSDEKKQDEKWTYKKVMSSSFYPPASGGPLKLATPERNKAETIILCGHKKWDFTSKKWQRGKSGRNLPQSFSIKLVGKQQDIRMGEGRDAPRVKAGIKQ